VREKASRTRADNSTNRQEQNPGNSPVCPSSVKSMNKRLILLCANATKDFPSRFIQDGLKYHSNLREKKDVRYYLFQEKKHYGVDLL